MLSLLLWNGFGTIALRTRQPSVVPDQTRELPAGVAGCEYVSHKVKNVWRLRGRRADLLCRRMRPPPSGRATEPEGCQKTTKLACRDSRPSPKWLLRARPCPASGSL